MMERAMPKHADTVPWTKLFPEIRGNTDGAMTRDSVRRVNGDRHYRVKLHLPHSRLREVERKLASYGFTVSRWTWLAYHNMVPVNGSTPKWRQAIKCIRHTPASA
jgi:hypothetical protein